MIISFHFIYIKNFMKLLIYIFIVLSKNIYFYLILNETFIIYPNFYDYTTTKNICIVTDQLI